MTIKRIGVNLLPSGVLSVTFDLSKTEVLIDIEIVEPAEKLDQCGPSKVVGTYPPMQRIGVLDLTE